MPKVLRRSTRLRVPHVCDVKVHGSAMKHQQPSLKFLGATDTETIDIEDLR
ncbi:hypothetical protein [Arthrobacter sp. ov407]|uniref:hypothetical protein n=1 Tax=Arthrobacter sp. ov407 TaxID=1761748 RepID=UPI0015A4632D|nr:hypothetical protein [Arthrobacter sp. ov407]